jgi:hypothetical protein
MGGSASTIHDFKEKYKLSPLEEEVCKEEMQLLKAKGLPDDKMQIIISQKLDRSRTLRRATKSVSQRPSASEVESLKKTFRLTPKSYHSNENSIKKTAFLKKESPILRFRNAALFVIYANRFKLKRPDYFEVTDYDLRNTMNAPKVLSEFSKFFWKVNESLDFRVLHYSSPVVKKSCNDFTIVEIVSTRQRGQHKTNISPCYFRYERLVDHCQNELNSFVADESMKRQCALTVEDFIFNNVDIVCEDTKAHLLPSDDLLLGFNVSGCSRMMVNYSDDTKRLEMFEKFRLMAPTSMERPSTSDI